MVLPLGRIIAQVVVPLIAVLARAIPAAYSQAIANARRNGVDATQTATSMLRREISKSEALQILNLTEAEATAEAVEKVCHFTVLLQLHPMHQFLRVMFRCVFCKIGWGPSLYGLPSCMPLLCLPIMYWNI
jgi:hypothetical protein